MAKVRRLATSRANSSDDDFSIGKDMDVPSFILLYESPDGVSEVCFNTWQRRKLQEGERRVACWSPVLAQRAVSEGPRWTRAVETTPNGLAWRRAFTGEVKHCSSIGVPLPGELTPSAERRSLSLVDIVLMAEPLPASEAFSRKFPGPILYGSRILDEETSLVTSFTPDEHERERYWVSVGSGMSSRSHLKDIVDAIVRIETYYHLLLMQKPLFSAAVDQAYKFEQVHLKQREIISEHIGHADSLTLQRWLNGLTQDLLKTTRLSGRLHFELSASIPYDKIVHRTLASLDERPLPLYRPISEYVLSGITGVAEGYQQLLKRMETLRSGFEGTISIIRARVDLMLQSQNLTLLMSVDKTTKSQAILQYTVEGLSVIVIAYYLSGLMAYIFKGLHAMGWLRDADIAAALFVPFSIGLALGITIIGRKLLHKKFSSEAIPPSI
ncbi:MAG: DUF3422 domain-containing protein [Nitrospira sp.]|nr:MAG: DUF3422 domain-containing protein [Nitrospira sp.]